MKVLKMMIMSGVLLGAIACSKEDDVAPAQSAPAVQSGGTTTEAAPVKGKYLVSRFEQDGVENPELRMQEVEFTKEQEVAVRGRNYEYKGTWTYDAAKQFLNIHVPGEQIQAQAVNGDGWKVVGTTDSSVVLQADMGTTSKKLDLLVKREVNGL
jgi:hypothetical protein